MGEGEGMAQGFIGQTVSARRKESGEIWAGVAACHMWRRRWDSLPAASTAGTEEEKRRAEKKGKAEEEERKGKEGR